MFLTFRQLLFYSLYVSVFSDCVFVCLDTQSYDYGEDLGVTAVALYDYQASE